MLSFPKTFKFECENRTHALLQRLDGLALLELSELSSCAFSQSENYFARVVPVIAWAWHRNEAPKSAFLFGTYRFDRYRCHVGTGFRYPTLMDRASDL